MSSSERPNTLRSRVRQVKSFDSLASAPFADGVNAICWERALPAGFTEVVTALGSGEGVVVLEDDRLRSLAVSPLGRAAIEFMLDDQRRLRERGLDPVLNCIYEYPHDNDATTVPTDVYSFHADSAPVEADTWLCTYFGAPSEGLDNDAATRRVEDVSIRQKLRQEFAGTDETEFEEWLTENCYDLHYTPGPNAQPFSFGVGSLWRIAVDWPGSAVPPCIHRAPLSRVGDPPRLLLIS